MIQIIDKDALDAIRQKALDFTISNLTHDPDEIFQLVYDLERRRLTEEANQKELMSYLKKQIERRERQHKEEIEMLKLQIEQLKKQIR